MSFPLLLLACAASAAPAPADLILVGGKVFLGPGRYAEAVAVAGNRVAVAGTRAAVLELKGEKTRVIELRGRAVTPGFHDAHAHLFKGALFLNEVDLNGSTSVAEVQQRVREYLRKRPDKEWVVGRGWDHTAFPDQKYPTAADLDAVVSSKPVALTDVDGHKLWLNTEGLRRAGVVLAVTKAIATKPPNPDILRDDGGRATGILLEDAIKWAEKAVPQPTRAEKLDALRKALALARASGVTALDSMPGPVDIEPAEQFALWKELYDAREFTLRIFLYGRLDDPDGFAKLRPKAAPYPRTRFDLIGLKGFVDGVLSARTAALKAPYFDDHETAGTPRFSPSKLASLVRRAHRHGFQAALHAIGDRAVRLSLDACAKAVAAAKADGRVLPPYPCRIEHIEVLDPGDAGLFKTIPAAASMQPSHMTYDNEQQNYNPNRLGDRAQHAFAWKELSNAGALLAFGTDWPVMPLPPRVALFAAVTRRHFNGKPEKGWIPKQSVSLESAVEHYTLGPARAIGKDSELGAIAPGQLADLVVFDRDLFAAEGMDLLKVEVDLTVFDGKVVYERPGGR